MIIETKRLDEAMHFVRKITEGENPCSGSGRPLSSGTSTGTDSSADEILNHPDMIRNMFFIYGILSDIKSGEMTVRTPVPFPRKILDEFRYTEDKGIKNLIKQIYAPVTGGNVVKLTPQMAGNWLRDSGYLTVRYDPEYKSNTAVPTESGKAIGLYSQAREYQGRRFMQVYYSKPAQEFIVEHFEEILNHRKKQH